MGGSSEGTKRSVECSLVKGKPANLTRLPDTRRHWRVTSDQYRHQQLRIVLNRILGQFASTSIGVVSGHELEGLVAEKDGEGELQDHHPLIE